MGCRSCRGTKVNVWQAVHCSELWVQISLAGTPVEPVHPSKVLRKGPVRGHVILRGRKYSHKQEPSASPPDENEWL